MSFPFTDRPVAGLGLSPATAAALAQRYRFVALPADVDPATEVLALQKGTVDLALLDRLPSLRLVATSAAGYDNVDLALLRSRGIMLSNRGNSRDIDVADLAIGLLLAAVRQIGHYDRQIRAGHFSEVRILQRQRVSGRKLGILGLGRIGEDICTRAAGFGLTIGYHNRRTRPDLPYPYFASALDLAAWADFLVVAVPLDTATRHQVDRQVLDALGPDGCLINIARGGVVDEAALIAALEEGTLGCAGLDVFASEPHVPERLRALNNVVMTPHIGGFTRATQHDALAALIDNIDSYFRSGRPLALIEL